MTHKQTLLALVVLIVAGALLGSLVSLSPSQAVPAAAQSEDSQLELKGFAWSPNIGWISFRGSNYGVVWDTDTNELSGHAWANPKDGVAGASGDPNANNIGWISFDETSGFPVAPNNKVQINPATGDLSGWARAVVGSATLSGESPTSNPPGIPDCTDLDALDTNPNSDCWNGWIFFGPFDSDTVFPAAPYHGARVEKNSAGEPVAFSGFAWGGSAVSGDSANESAVVGWVRLGLGLNGRGVCLPDESEVCVDTTETDTFLVTCSPDNNPVILSGTPLEAQVTWTAYPRGGKGPYDYEWSGDLPGGDPENVNTFTKTYTTPGNHQVTVKATDDDTPAQEDSYNCSVVVDDEIDIPDECTGECNGGELEAQGQNRVITITSQVSGQPAMTVVGPGQPAISIKNIGDRPVTNIKVTSIQSQRTGGGELGDLLDDIVVDNTPLEPRCQMLVNPTYESDSLGPTVDCYNPSIEPLLNNSTDLLFFRLQIPLPLKVVKDNNPYIVTITGKTTEIHPDGDGNPVTTERDVTIPVKLLFDYAVGSFDPL